ncbi:hypothetical protein [Amycolatopsis methanolica]|uniref:Uncharacterized protein n=1 Tax=Amycolatopsis methanolica 239 TaxID=1068978 RepID=A0A076MXB4_AMYME|nr:hypothetical protein [Amycolatopsis methanolica]AIJ25368.1 hypothetical protein AMETH_5276 [Amycolatopsis methanolica 239]
MEETQYRFYRLRDDLTYYLAETPPEQVDREVVRRMFGEYQGIWDSLGERWLSHRRPGEGP